MTRPLHSRARCQRERVQAQGPFGYHGMPGPLLLWCHMCLSILPPEVMARYTRAVGSLAPFRDSSWTEYLAARRAAEEAFKALRGVATPERPWPPISGAHGNVHAP